MSLSNGEPNDTKVEHLLGSLHLLNDRLEALGIVEINGEMTYLSGEEDCHV